MGCAGARKGGMWSLAVTAVVFLRGLAVEAGAATWYVAPGGDDAAAGTNWATAKATIQAAVDAAGDGDEVLVSNGVYNSGGRVVYGSIRNRVAIDKAVTVRSVNGPGVTIIQGSGPLGDHAVRCVYLGTNAALYGFTLTNGHTRTSGNPIGEMSGGGAWCEDGAVLSNCVISGNAAAEGGGGVYKGTLYNCTLSGNSAGCGGGAYGGTLSNCTLSGNSAMYGGGGAGEATLYNCTLSSNVAENGGGAYYGTLHDCILSGNSADGGGGGAYQGTLYNCTLSSNSAECGGGTEDATLHSCILRDNSAVDHGGGAYFGTLYNCILIGNSASEGGGAEYATLHNCTLWGNSADYGAGVCRGTLYNCIVWGNESSSLLMRIGMKERSPIAAPRRCRKEKATSTRIPFSWMSKGEISGCGMDRPVLMPVPTRTG